VTRVRAAKKMALPLILAPPDQSAGADSNRPLPVYQFSRLHFQKQST